ncbi:hypothetical protein [Mycobacterium simiae]|uniref:hypothetical protein n=1 Tax=Mycobacterium simiae TaxID=1784 RepID=UPI002604E067|nr:hypothetical protein [Mycobacterium simiae]
MRSTSLIGTASLSSEDHDGEQGGVAVFGHGGPPDLGRARADMGPTHGSAPRLDTLIADTLATLVVLMLSPAFRNSSCSDTDG